MADNLIFPIGFDLQQAVEKAGKEWDKTYAKRLEIYLAKRPVKVKLNFENLNDVKTRLAQLKIEPITPETKASIKELARELQVLAKALEQVQKYSKNPAQLGQQNFRNDVQLEKLRQANERLEIQKRRVALAEQKHAEAMKRSASASKQLSSEFQTQEGYVSRLVKRLAVYASFSAVSGLLTNIRQVTAEFELQRVSLGAIIQDQERANQLFGEIKSFALKSPVSILDLTKYTKQIAAYGVETEKLFDTTKMLTDVSVGLGTPLSQLALAFGQIRSSSVLRLAETRQLTEAGIPALELLAKQLEKTYGRFVSTAEVMELISKRAISFEMVEQMFKDMTSAGGAFYNMQEKQGNTLFGLWAKLGDAASVMYDEIGNTSSVNSGMKEAIRLLSDLMRNWRNVGLVVAESAAVFAIWKLQAVNAAPVTNALTAAEVRALAVKKVHYKMQPAIIRGIIGETNARKLSIITVRAHAAAVRASATSTNIFTKAWYSLEAAFLSNPFGIALTALAAIATYLMFADDKVKRFKEDLDSIKEGGAVEATKSAYNFEQLAEKAVNAADGSMEQKDALDELQRTYKDMIPIQDLTIEKLKALKGNYDSLTQSIKEYVYQRNLQQQIDRIIEERTGTMTRIEQKLRDELKEGVKYQVSDAVHTKDLGIDDNQISALFSRIKTEAKNTTKDVQAIIRESIDEIFGYLSQEDRNLLYAIGYNKLAGETDDFPNTLQSIIELQRAMDGEIENASKSMSQYTGYLGEYKKELDNITESVKKYRLVNTKGEAVERDTFLFQQGQQNFQIKQWANSIKSELEDAGVTIQDGIFNLVDGINENDPTKISTIDFAKLLPMLDTPDVKRLLGNSYETFKNYILSIQELYDGVVPSDPIVQAVRNNMFAIGNATKGGMDVMKKHLWDGKTSIEEHLKALKASSDTLQAELYKYANYIKQYGILGKAALLLRGIDYDALAAEYDALTKQIEYVQTYVKENDSSKFRGGTKSTKSDNRLQNLQEIEQTLTKINQKYDELVKKEGQTKALEDINKLYANTLKYVNKLGKQFKLSFKMPTEFKDLQQYRKAILDVINKLRMKGYEKAALGLEEKIGTGNLDVLQKDIEKQIKELADRISRTKTAKEFYEKILDMTGDIQLSANLAVSVYGQNGQDLQDAIREQIKTAFETDPEKNVTIDLSEAIDPDTGAINYNKLAELEEKYKDVLIGGRADLRQKLIDEGRKTSAAQAQQWLKDIEKAKDFAQQRIDLATYTANQIAAINARTDLPQADKDKLTKGYQDREAKQLAKLQYDEFKDSAIYVHIFEDLDHASTTALKNMRDRLIALKGQWQHLDPTQVKELTKAIADLDEQIAGRSPFKSILDGFKGLASARPQKVIDVELLTATEELTRREEALTAATKKYTEAQTAQLNAQAEVAQARQDLEDALAVSGGEETAEVKAAREVLGIKIATFNAVKAASKDSISAAKTEVDKASEKYEEQKKVIDKLVEEGKIREANIKKIELANQKIDEYQQQINEALDGVRKMMEAFGASDEDMQFFDDVVGALNEIVDAGQQAAASVGNIMSGNPFQIFQGVTQGIGAIGGLVSGFTNLFYAGRVKRANKEIKRQQELLDQLEYTYGRLEKAAEKLFGADYLNNYNQQIKNLQARQQAYLKQAQAERSKGKKEDKEKTQEYLNNARDVADQIADMQGKIAERMLGTDLTSAARDFANAWLEAYKEFGNTADAMSEKFHEMIQNMIVESLLAKVMERALKPAFDMIDNMNEEDFYSESFWKKVMATAEQGAKDADHGAGVVMKWIEKMGYDMREMGSEYSGIAKEVSSASSEEINQLSAFVNTALYYVSPIPTISENVSLIRQLMERGTTSTLPDTTAAGWTDWQQQAMDNYIAIQRNTADTVVECRRAANACEASVEKLGRIITSKGSVSGVNVFMKG